MAREQPSSILKLGDPCGVVNQTWTSAPLSPQLKVAPLMVPSAFRSATSAVAVVLSSVVCQVRQTAAAPPVGSGVPARIPGNQTRSPFSGSLGRSAWSRSVGSGIDTKHATAVSAGLGPYVEVLNPAEGHDDGNSPAAVPLFPVPVSAHPATRTITQLAAIAALTTTARGHAAT